MTSKEQLIQDFINNLIPDIKTSEIPYWEYSLKWIKEWEAFDLKTKEWIMDALTYIANNVFYLEKYCINDIKYFIIDLYNHYLLTKDVVFKTDVYMTISSRIPETTVKYFQKMLEEYKELLSSSK